MSASDTKARDAGAELVFDRRPEARTLARRLAIAVASLVGFVLVALSVGLELPWLPLPLALVVAAVIAGGGILLTRGSDAHARVVVEPQGLAIDGPVGTVRVPFESIRGLRHTGDSIELLGADGRTLGELHDVLLGELELFRRIALRCPLLPPKREQEHVRPGYAVLEGTRLVRPEGHDDRPIELDEIRRVDLIPPTANEVVGALVLDLHLDARRVIVTTDVATGMYVLAARGGLTTEVG
ncbi:MAG: PH domain-containing protein [Polyangiales bacterium]